ncbi:MAG: response regulator transcription factor [Dehalococcoidia bacterium]|nr:response regulator transcription factor [Dehalococcoidia bacterium]
MSAQTEIRILLVDDHEVVRRGLRTLLMRKGAFVVIGEAGSKSEAIREAARLQPDLVIMDVRLPDGTGVEACQAIRTQNPNIKVLMLTSFPDEEFLFSSIQAGAAGYLLKDIKSDELVAAIRKVAAGQSLIDPAMTQKLLERLMSPQPSRPQDRLSILSPLEYRILELVTEGKTNKEIAEKLHLSDKTVKNYVSTILSKLDVNRRAEAAAYLASHRREGSGSSS